MRGNRRSGRRRAVPQAKRVEDSAAVGQETQARPRLKTDQFASPGRILVVDDDPLSREMLTAVLRQDLQTVLQAENGQQCLEIAREKKPDVILLDILMPVMDGLEACRKLKADPHLHYVPVLVMTGAAEDDSQTRALECGANDFLAKPVRALDLTTRVRALLKYRRALEALVQHQMDLEERVEARTSALMNAHEKLVAEYERRRRAQEALENERATLRTMLDSLPDVVYLKDTASRFVAANRNTLTDLQAEDMHTLLGKTDRDFLPPEIAEKLLAEEQEIMKTGIPIINRESRHARDGVEHIFLITKLPLRDSTGKTAGLLGINRDVTEYRRLEQQLQQAQKMEAIGQLAGGIAHDFNNMLMIIMGYAECLQMEPRLSTSVKDQVEAIHHTAQRAAQLTRQLLTFSRRQTLQPEDIDLNAVLTEMKQMAQRLIGEHIALNTVLADGLRSVRADAGQLEQVIMNLLLNARDAMPHGGTLTVETANLDAAAAERGLFGQLPPGRYVLLKITDTGHGMTPETQARLFEPFFTTKPFGKGTGLGLAVVYGVVKQSGGHIHISSNLNKGTTFSILLPAVEAEAMAETKAPLPQPGGGTETVLLVEDERQVRELARSFLLKYGYSVLAEPDPQAALKRLSSIDEPIHLVITDVLMPGMNGTEFVRQLKRKRPDVRVLYISGYPAEATSDHGVLDPGDGFLQKPFSALELSRKVRDVLDAPQ